MPLDAVVAVEPVAPGVRAEAVDLARAAGLDVLEAPAEAATPIGRRRWLASTGLGDAVVAWHDRDGWALADAARPEARLVRAGADRRAARDEPLGRACGVHRRDPTSLTVVDATAGLGRDAATIAGWGCRVTLIERSAVLAALLADLVARSPRLTLIRADAVEALAAWPRERRPDVVLLDPMHPPRRKSARVKHDLELLARLLGSRDAPDAENDARLLAAARALAPRVVVKRPPHAAPLGDVEPDHVVDGSRVRFDVLLG